MVHVLVKDMLFAHMFIGAHVLVAGYCLYQESTTVVGNDIWCSVVDVVFYMNDAPWCNCNCRWYSELTKYVVRSVLLTYIKRFQNKNKSLELGVLCYAVRVII